MIEKGGRTVNEIYKELAVFLEELRCDTYEKKYAVKTEDLKKADNQLKEKNRKFEAFLNDISEKDKEFIESYLNAVKADKAYGTSEAMKYINSQKFNFTIPPRSNINKLWDYNK